MNKGIGITERGDAGLDFTWEKKVPNYRFSILITKNLNDDFINKVKDLPNVIVHATITGYGGTTIEPNVPTTQWSLTQLKKLIDTGFPIERIVARVDPMFPTERGEVTASFVINECVDIGIKRIRYSYVDLYGHVRERFRKAGIDITPFKNLNFMRKIIPQYPNVSFESCAEGLDTDVGCISPYDFELFGIESNTEAINGQNRNNCKCLACKTELLNYKNNKRCPHQCLYCYWKD